jgi:hypothetical protein
MLDERENEERPYPEEDVRGTRQLAYLWRGLAAMGVVAAGALAVLGVALIGFAQVIPAVLAFGASAMVALISVPVLWAKLPHDKRHLGRRMNQRTEADSRP